MGLGSAPLVGAGVWADLGPPAWPHWAHKGGVRSRGRQAASPAQAVTRPRSVQEGELSRDWGRGGGLAPGPEVLLSAAALGWRSAHLGRTCFEMAVALTTDKTVKSDEDKVTEELERSV